MRKMWELKKEVNNSAITLFRFYDSVIAEEALDKIRNEYLRFYINTDERIEAWNTRPKAAYIPTFDEETGLRVYDRQEWIEDVLCRLEDEMYSFFIEEHDLIEDIHEFKFEDTNWYYQDDNKTENAYKLFQERARIQAQKRKAYLETRKDKPSGYIF